MFGGVIVDRDTNEQQIHMLPLQLEIGPLIHSGNGGDSLPETILQYQYRRQTHEEVDYED